MVEFVLTWQPTMGWTAFACLIAIWLAIAVGVTWARFKRIEISDSLQRYIGPDDDFGWNVYRLPVRNFGAVGVEVPVYLQAIANENGYLEAPLPLELSWMHQDVDFRPVLSKGHLFNVNIFKIGFTSDPANPSDQDARGMYPVFCGMNKKSVFAGLDEVVSLTRKNKLWIAISVDSYDNMRWFSLEGYTDGKYSLFKVELDEPPFLKKSSVFRIGKLIGWIQSAFSRLLARRIRP